MSELSIYAAFHPATIRQGLSFEERSQIAHQAGFRHTAFDIAGAMKYDGEHGAGAAAEMLKGLDLAPDGWGGSPGITLPGDEFDRRLAGFEELCRYAAAFGPGNVNDCMVFVPNRWPVPEAEALVRVARNLGKLGEIGAGHGVRISIEFCGPNLAPDEPHAFISWVAGALRMAGATGRENVGVLVDSYHLYCAGEEPEIIDRLGKGRVFAAHLNDSPPGDHSNFTDAERVMPGDGILPLVDFIQHLDRAGFAGAIACELFNPEIRLGDPVEVARESRVKSDAIIAEALGPG